ncbi:DinB family protein [Rhodococcus artemisiae]|uniref:DinB family protein n=1 Tax=Rhodococcus artemisiae TaxID=714159 RepID=A0ABU7LGZ1_9NOCA|nr:DinB family protein [Rhodococcus artemisiae]MEE2060830.1 DinB family protein [Rhodococcus artemisiae]
MTGTDGFATDLVEQLQVSRDLILWKLDGVSEYDARRPMTPTGTNLLGLVKHLATCEFGYFGEAFGRPSPVALPWADPEGADGANIDMWATADQTREYLVGLYRRSWQHAAETFAATELDDVTHVELWGQGRATLHRVLVHMNSETARHAGHADIVREMIDGSVGWRRDFDNLPYREVDRMRAHHARVQAEADHFR